MTADVHGHCDARFDKLADAFAQALTDGEEVGAAMAIDIDGETVVGPRTPSSTSGPRRRR